MARYLKPFAALLGIAAIVGMQFAAADDASAKAKATHHRVVAHHRVVHHAAAAPAPKGTKCVNGLSPGCGPGSCRCDYF